MKKLLLSCLLITGAYTMSAQEVWVDFDGIKNIYFSNGIGLRTGVLDSMMPNPSPNMINNSANVAKYVRDSVTQYDYLKMYTTAKLTDITPYADSAATMKMKMKVYTDAPAGSPIIIQLGIKGVDNYPAGIHSEYIGLTYAQNQWHEIAFNFMQRHTGSMAGPTDIDKIVVLFAAGSYDNYTFYFDEVSGPALTTSGVAEIPNNIKLLQNSPNPAKENTNISFSTVSTGHVSLKVYDLMGHLVATLADEDMKAGTHTLPFNTVNLQGGVYFYVLKTDAATRTRRMVIDK